MTEKISNEHDYSNKVTRLTDSLISATHFIEAARYLENKLAKISAFPGMLELTPADKFCIQVFIIQHHGLYFTNRNSDIEEESDIPELSNMPEPPLNRLPYDVVEFIEHLKEEDYRIHPDERASF